ncbi:MAG TPA: UDP-N-acetylglucosamine 2-epimerase (non-hydrolyzing) [Acidimicrobiales bacterium]|nr:UDP-N-acetylglucosamine 2-epimerase (non-hydrolyzing) [Acidimicrobiales bacterium]
MIKVMSIFGTRPEAIKMAPFVLAVEDHPELASEVVVTAQHRSMLDQVLDLFGIHPDRDLDMMQTGQSLAAITTRAVDGLSAAIDRTRPDVVAVQGDTTTTFAGALAAFYNQIPVVHLEAGLRTFDRYSPYPEEINRRLTSSLTTLHLPPTATARENLLAEGVKPEDVVVTGNTVIDALKIAVDKKAEWGDPALEGLDDDPRRVLAVTAHRRESWGAPMENIGRALARLAARYDNLVIVFPIHKNPVVREAILPAVNGLENVVVVEPLAYGGFSRLLDRATVVLTDSGGVQEEAPSLGKPVLVMRDTTERPEAVAAGTARLVGTDEDIIVSSVSSLLDDAKAYDRMASAVNPYGDGRAAERSIAAILHMLGRGERPDEFSP